MPNIINIYGKYVDYKLSDQLSVSACICFLLLVIGMSAKSSIGTSLIIATSINKNCFLDFCSVVYTASRPSVYSYYIQTMLLKYLPDARFY